MRLLEASRRRHVASDFHCFSLPSVQRSQTAKWRVDRQYTDIADLARLRDRRTDRHRRRAERGNACPRSRSGRTSPTSSTGPKTNTRSTIWSCLAAHAAVLHLDGIERHRLGAKCSGVYDCAKVTDHWLTQGYPSPLKVPHSRLNELRASDLVCPGLSSADAIAAKPASISSPSSCAANSSSSRDIRNMRRCRCSGNICATSPAISPASATVIRPSLPAISTPRPKTSSLASRSGRAPNASCR